MEENRTKRSLGTLGPEADRDQDRLVNEGAERECWLAAGGIATGRYGTGPDARLRVRDASGTRLPHLDALRPCVSR